MSDACPSVPGPTLMKGRSAVVVGVLVLVAAAVGLGLWSRGPARVPVEVGAPAYRATFRSTVTASGEIVATRYADIGSSVMGKIVALPVAEGDRVKAGQILARIDAVQAQSDVSGAAEQTRALEAEERGATDQARAASFDLEAAEARARDAEQQLARKLELANQKLVPAAELDSALAAADSARAQVASARAGVDRARQALAAASRRVSQARAQQVRADDILAKTSIISPIDGVVSRLRVREGEMVVIGIQNQPGTTLMTVSDLSGINAEVKVAEADVLRVKLEQPATVTLEALPGREFTGRVVEIGASALPVSGTGAAAREFKVVVRLDGPDPGLRPGLTCDAEIVTSEKQNVLTVPLQSVVLRQVEGGAERSGLFVVRDGRAIFTAVDTGIIGGLDIEVSGLARDVPIVTGPYQVLRELQNGAAVQSTVGKS
jgi:HlyD family secretion protein